ncbi:glycosyltransferase [Methylocystis parvus]|uniref:glycosyltransferase n=1 Tax=Methylocystis parvus TaxID=134 RepID=UPI000302470F|nr:glycosyltransferase [Methylocystis parvus]WBJ99687.1 glycosyltransferase [Methylocystis parvus OBBP]
MSFLDVLTWAAAAYWAAAIALLIISVVATVLQPRIAEKRARRRDQPPVSIVLPVKLLDADFERTQESVFAQHYPRFDVTASAVDTDSPAARKMRELFARHPETPSRLLASTAHFAASPKVDNLYAPFMQAENDVILMKDANVLLEPDALAEHLRQLNDDVGLVCAIPYCAGLDNFAAHVEAAIINGPHARILFLASCLGQGHGIGKIMLFRRSDFLRAGGFDAISHTVGEDNALAKAMRRIGQRPVFSHRAVRQELGARRFLDVYQRQLRWFVIRRNDELLSFVAEPICQAFPALVAGALAAPLIGMAPVSGFAATFGFWFTLETLLSMAKGWQLSYAAPAVFVIREAMMLAVWVNAWMTDRVVWAKDKVHARVAAQPAPPAHEEG